MKATKSFERRDTTHTTRRLYEAYGGKPRHTTLNQHTLLNINRLSTCISFLHRRFSLPAAAWPHLCVCPISHIQKRRLGCREGNNPYINIISLLAGSGFCQGQEDSFPERRSAALHTAKLFIAIRRHRLLPEHLFPHPFLFSSSVQSVVGDDSEA